MQICMTKFYFDSVQLTSLGELGSLSFKFQLGAYFFLSLLLEYAYRTLNFDDSVW